MLKITLKIILIFLTSQSILSCKPMPDRKAPSKFFKEDLKNASPDFQQGWADGCETGMAGGSNSFNQMFYKGNKQDGYKFAYSPDYKVAWGNAFWFCYRANWVDQRATPFGSFFKGMI